MSETSPTIPTRVLSVDALRGFVLLLMMAEVMQLYSLASHHPDCAFCQHLRFHTTHVEWGCLTSVAWGSWISHYVISLHDLIQPAFSFLVGVSLPFSIAQRTARGQSFWLMLFHAAWRSILLVALGIFLRSVGRPQTNWMFTDTLGQIGLGYTFLFLLGMCWQRFQWLAFAVILVAYWALFAFWPSPSADFDYAKVGEKSDWQAKHSYRELSLLAHWNKNTNPAAEFDAWFLNQFPRKEKFAYEGGGYATLSFIPTLATMILGLLAGGWLRTAWTHWRKYALFVSVGFVGIGLGLASEYLEICPIVKRIWTPAWVLYSGGWVFLMLAVFYAVIEMIGFWHWAFPLLVLGANSIVAYCANGLFRSFLTGTLHTHLGKDTFDYFGDAWKQPLAGAAVLLMLWLMLLWMYYKKIFVKI